MTWRQGDEHSGRCLHRASVEVVLRHEVAREVQEICIRPLARNLNGDADLRAPKGVRIVWWGFRALKTPEERSHRRRFSVGSLPCLGHQLNAITGQILDKDWIFTRLM